MIPGCADLYTGPKLDRRYVAGRLKMSERDLSDALHLVKAKVGLHGSPVWICLDDGNVWDPHSLECIGNLFDV